MFNKKEEKKEEKVVCGECKCWLSKDDAQEVKGRYGYNFYYCQAHRKPYQRVFISGFCEGFEGRYSYFKEIEVDINGEPIGYTKNDNLQTKTK